MIDQRSLIWRYGAAARYGTWKIKKDSPSYLTWKEVQSIVSHYSVGHLSKMVNSQMRFYWSSSEVVDVSLVDEVSFPPKKGLHKALVRQLTTQDLLQ